MAKQYDDIVDIDLSTIRKKRIRVNGDDNIILELNTSDFNIITRMNDVYPKLKQICSELALSETPENDEEALKVLSEQFTKADSNMRALLDELFDSNVSEICAPFGNLYDIINGQFRFEVIIETLSKVYENNFNEEFKRMQMRISKKTSKYTGKKK